VRTEYANLLTWFAGSSTNFAVNIGKHSWKIGQYVPPEFYAPLINSYPHAELAEIRSALDSLMAAFPALAQQVADELGFCYNADEGERTLRFIKEFYSN
jgi:hypothetical protein